MGDAEWVMGTWRRLLAVAAVIAVVQLALDFGPFPNWAPWAGVPLALAWGAFGVIPWAWETVRITWCPDLPPLKERGDNDAS